MPPYLARSMRGRRRLKSGLRFVAAPQVRLALSELLYLIRPAGRHVHPLLDEIEGGIAGGAP